MMEAGELDETVERCAFLLSSSERIQSGGSLLMDLCKSGDDNRLSFARLAQELAAYSGGAVLRRLLWMTLGQQPGRVELDSQGRRQFLASSYSLSFGLLTSSKVAVERCLREGLYPEESESGRGPEENGNAGTGRREKDTGVGPEWNRQERKPAERENARRIYAPLMLHIAHYFKIVGRSEELSNGQVLRDLGTLMLAGSLEILSNFTRASKAFRDAIRDAAEQRNMSEQFGDLLRPEYLAKMSRGSALEIRLAFGSLAVSLAYSVDSQTWAIDRGLLKLIAAIYEASPVRETSKWHPKRFASPAYRCNMALFRLLTVDSAVEKMRAHNALEGFRPFKRTINAVEQESLPWAYFEGRLQGRVMPLRRELSAAEWKLMEERISGSFWTPVVCSWKLCAAGREPVVGKGFSKCGRCQVARYCSKEHQKLHWETHKKHCKAS